MRYMIRFLIAAALLAACDTASAAAAKDEDAPSIKASISRKRILVGDRIRYRCDIYSKLDLEFEYPKFKDNKINECEIKDSGRELKKSFFGGKRDYLYWLDITSYYLGKRTFPALEIKYREKGEGNWKTLKTEKQEFTVESVLPRNMKLYDIKDIKGPVYPFSILKLIGWIALALALLWAGVKIAARMKKGLPPKMPHEIALEALEAAKAGYLKNGDIKDYYVRISDTVRRYIETVFKVRAPEMTTQEFLGSLGTAWKVQEDYKNLLKQFMEACDLVKFARHAPAREEADSAFDAAKRFIEGTKSESELNVHI